MQQGVENSHAEARLTVVDNFSPQQQPFSSVGVDVPPLNLAALPQASPLAFKPATPGHSSSSADTSEQGGVEPASAAVMTPNATARQQQASNAGEVSFFATADLVELRAELRAGISAQNELRSMDDEAAGNGSGGWGSGNDDHNESGERTDKETTRAQLAAFNNNMVALRTELSSRSLPADGNKATLIARLKTDDESSKVTGDEGLSGASREVSPSREGSALAPSRDTSELPVVGVGNELVQLPASPETTTGVSPPADVVGDPTGSENSGGAPAAETLTLEVDVGNSSGLHVSATSPGAENSVACCF